MFHHPMLYNGVEFVSDGRLPKPEYPNEPVLRRAARAVLQEYWLAAASDIFESRRLGLPLGAGVVFETEIVSELCPSVTAEDVVFQMNLPVLSGLSSKELIALRENERDSFEAFRIALRKAAKERVAIASSTDPGLIAREIEQDIIEPSLNAIARKLAAAEQVLKKKHALSLGMVGLATACGVLGEIPLATALVMGAIASAATAEAKAAEERRDIALDDMYFLWKGQEQHAAEQVDG